MSSEWLKNEGSKHHMRSLLTKAGLPLEVQVAKLCKDFASRHTKKQGIRISSERLVYGGPEEETLREVDQYVNLHKEFDTKGPFNVQQMLEIPIECKHRDGMAVFGFPYEEPSRRLVSYPMFSDLSPSYLLRRAATVTLPLFEKQPLCTIGLVEVSDDGRVPRKVHEENLVYKTGAALYDFVKISAALRDPDVDEPILTMLLRRFYQHLRETNYTWWVVYDWIDTLGDTPFRSYNEKKFPHRNMFLPVGIVVPVICLDAPLYLVDMSPSGEIEDFRPTDVLFTGIRVKNWPGIFRHRLARSAPEALVTVVSTSGLPKLLSSTIDMFLNVQSVFANAPLTVLDHAPLEAKLIRAVWHSADHEESPRYYRSDLDFEL